MVNVGSSSTDDNAVEPVEVRGEGERKRGWKRTEGGRKGEVREEEGGRIPISHMTRS
jgi:hypothetical protein